MVQALTSCKIKLLTLPLIKRPKLLLYSPQIHVHNYRLHKKQAAPSGNHQFFPNFLPEFFGRMFCQYFKWIYIKYISMMHQKHQKKLSQGGSHFNGLIHTHTTLDRSSAKILSLPFICVLENNFTTVTYLFRSPLCA